MSSDIVYVTDDSFEEDVLKSDIPVLVDYWAEWCGPCKMIAPILEEVVGEYIGKLKIAKLNIDENSATPPKYGIRGIPTLMIFRDQIAIFSQAGMLPETALEEVIGKTKELDMDQVRKEVEEQQAQAQQQ